MEISDTLLPDQLKRVTQHCQALDLIEDRLPGLETINKAYNNGARFDELKKLAVIHGSMPVDETITDAVNGIIVEAKLIYSYEWEHYEVILLYVISTNALRRNKIPIHIFDTQINGHWELVDKHPRPKQYY